MPEEELGGRWGDPVHAENTAYVQNTLDEEMKRRGE